MTPEPPVHDLGELERLLAEATPGPWRWVGKDLDGSDFATVIEVRDLPEHAYSELQSGELQISEADMALIASARNALPDLIAVVEAAKPFNFGETVPGVLAQTDGEIVGMQMTVSSLRKLRAALRPFYGGGAG